MLETKHESLSSLLFGKKEEMKYSYTIPPQKGLLTKILRHPLCMPYNRLALSLALVNIVCYKIFSPQFSTMNETQLLEALFVPIVLNFMVATIIRSQYVINLLFAMATSIPTSFPLSLRWACGKVYHFGGIQVGTYFSGAMWLFYLFTQIDLSPLSELIAVHIGVLTLVMLVSLPKFRAKYHNNFEIIARFGNWTSLALFWVETILFIKTVNHEATLAHLLNSPFIWALVLITFITILPWLKLKKVPVQVKTPSNHVALASFNYGETPFAGSSTDLSFSPLLEWHSFANVPAPNTSGFRLTISRAGDWTGDFIKKRPQFIWRKGITTAGVGNVEKLFKKVIWVATGSGVGPCIPHLLTKKVPSRLVWSTRNPRKTYGDELVDEILAVQPNPIIWDTTSQGKPNLVELAYKAYREFEAEAIICIANKKVTWQVVYEFESRGIPAFGAIWDS